MLLPFLASSQETETYQNWEIGVNVGTYKANKYNTIRYDGSDIEYPYNLDVQYHLDLNPNHPNSIYQRIRQSYGDLDFNLTNDSYPLDMRYKFGLEFGGHLGYKTDESSAFFVDVNFVNLTTVDAFTFEVDDPSTQTTQADIKVESIVGKEKRLNLNLGYHIGLGDDPDATPYLELGGNLTSTRVVENYLLVQEQKYVLSRFSKNLSQNSIYQNVDFGGVSYGGFIGGGYRFRMNEKFVFDFGGNMIFNKINLGSESIQKYKPHGSIFLRVLWS
jgi:hypothetical protein